jgi:Protein of unknown function (DUF664)
MEGPTMSREATVLLASLNRQREHVLGILDGLGEEPLHRPVLPSGWTCLGLVQHLALDVERFWFRGVVAGEQIDATGASGQVVEDAWIVGPDAHAEDVFSLYRREVARANAIVATTSPDAAPVTWPSRWSNWRYEDLREVILHVIAETSCHAGHLDAVRELLDGRRWMVLS